MFTHILIAFLIGGGICGIVQIIMDTTPFSISNAHVLVALVLIGEILGFFGIYTKFSEFAGMGASIPLCGFGNTLINGVFDDIGKNGLLGIFSGGFTAGAVGLCGAVVFALMVATIFKPKG